MELSFLSLLAIDTSSLGITSSASRHFLLLSRSLSIRFPSNTRLSRAASNIFKVELNDSRNLAINSSSSSCWDGCCCCSISPSSCWVTQSGLSEGLIELLSVNSSRSFDMMWMVIVQKIKKWLRAIKVTIKSGKVRWWEVEPSSSLLQTVELSYHFLTVTRRLVKPRDYNRACRNH